MSLLNDLLRPPADRQPQPAPAPVAQRFTIQQDFLAACRLELVPNYERQQQLLDVLLGQSHIAPWPDLWPMVHIAKNIVPPQNLAVVFGICTDGASGAPAQVQAPPNDLLDGIYIYGVMTEFLTLARTNEPTARRWHKDYQHYFPKGIALTDPLPTIVAAAQHRKTGLETYVFAQLLWLKSDALSFLPEPGKPKKGWADAYRFLWGFQRLPDFLRDQLNPCQLLIARLQPAPPAK